MPIDSKQIRKHHEEIGEIHEVVGVWEIWINKCPVGPLKVKVVKLEEGDYMGIMNYRIKNPGQASPYRSMTTKNSIQEAVEDSIRGFLMWWRPEQAEQTEFELDKDW